MAKPTIIDVAARAGVSKSTVSLVLQGSPLVKRATRDLVQRAMQDLGYVYNAAAAGLRIGKAPPPQPRAPLCTIPVSVDLNDLNAAPFLAALQTAAAAKGMDITILRRASDLPGRKITTRFAEAGAALCLFALHPMGTARMQEGEAAAAATRHLLGLGAGPVAFVGGAQTDPVHAQRMRGYQQRMAQAGAAPLLLGGGEDFEFGRTALGLLLDGHPQFRAALCINDQVALGMLAGLRARDIALGDGFRVVGWGDTQAAQSAGLSSLRPDMGKLAECCVAWVCHGGERAHDIPLTLIRRKSSMGGA